MKRDKASQLRFIFCIAGICVLLMIMIVSFIRRYSSFQVTAKQEIERDLKNTTQVSADILNQTIENAYVSIEQLAEFCDVPDGTGKENWWEILKDQKKEGMVSIADTQGKFYYGDHQVKLLNREEVWKYPLSEGRFLSEICKEGYASEDKRDCLILSVPIKTKQGIEGYVCIEYSTVYLGDLVNTAETKNRGATMVIDGQGRLVASYEGMEQFKTIYDMLAEKEFGSEESVESFKKSFQDGEDGYNIYHGFNKVYEIKEEKNAMFIIREWG